jgi:hypothetical protein
VHWVPLSTNASPFIYVETNMAAYPKRFYRATPYTVIRASQTISPISPNAFRVSVHGATGCRYVVEESVDLSHWTPVTTNVVPFDLLVTNIATRPACFYRGRLIAPP